MISFSTRLYTAQQQLWQRSSALLYKLRRHQFDNRPMRNTPERVLIVLAGLIGDTVMSTPLLIEVRRLWPKTRLTVLGQVHNCDLLAACPLIDEFIQTPVLPFSFRKMAQVKDLQFRLKHQNIDLAIIVLGDQFAQLLADAEIPVRVGVSGHILEPFLTHTYEIGSPRTWGPHERLNALRALGVDAKDVSPQLWVSDAARRSVSSTLETLNVTRNSSLVLLHPFASAATRSLPTARVAEIANRLHDELEVQVVLIGGSREVPAAEQVMSLVGEGISDLTGRLSIQETCALLERADVVVTTDSGPLHLAGALNRPTVGLFRAIRPEYANLYPDVRPVFWDKGPECLKGCSWDSLNGCRTVPCRQLTGIGEETILNAVRAIQQNYFSTIRGTHIQHPSMV